MSLSAQVLARVAAAEASHLRVMRMQRMTHAELRALLGGDPADAALWIASAAECALPAAQLCLGRMLLEGRGVPVDPARALRWFSRAAEQLDAEAMNMVGRCYENGWGAPTDARAAARWYGRSAARGHDWGQYNIGNLLFDGRGIEPDQPQALTWYRRAAAQGHSRAMNMLGRCCEEGWGCVRDLIAALDWYRRSADAGYFRGQFNYAALLAEYGLVNTAAAWFWRAACAGTPAIREAIVHGLAGVRTPALRRVREHIESL